MAQNVNDIDEEQTQSMKSTPYHVIISIMIGCAWWLTRYKLGFSVPYTGDLIAGGLLVLVNSFWLMVNTARYHTGGGYLSPDLKCSVSTKHKPITFAHWRVFVGGGNDILPDLPTQNVLICDPLPASQELGRHTKNYLGWCCHKKIPFEHLPTAVRSELQDLKGIPKDHVFIGTPKTVTKQVVDPQSEFWELQMLDTNVIANILSDIVKDKGIKIEDYLGSGFRAMKKIRDLDRQKGGFREWFNKRKSNGGDAYNEN